MKPMRAIKKKQKKQTIMKDIITWLFNIYYIIHFFGMSQEITVPHSLPFSQPLQVDSDDSQQFQDLQNADNYVLVVEDNLKSKAKSLNKIKSKQLALKCQQLRISQQKVSSLQQQLCEQSNCISELRHQIKSYISINQNSQKEIQTLKQQLCKMKEQNIKLKNSNQQIKNSAENLKQQSHQFIDKISCLQQKIELEKEDIQAKFKTIRKGLQKITKLPLKNMDNQNVVRTLTVRLDSVQKLLLKIQEIMEIIIEKKEKPKSNSQVFDLIEQNIGKVDKIQSILIKQQNKINLLKDQVHKLEQQVQAYHQSSKNPTLSFGKWLDPVMKFCKIENQRQGELRQRKSKNNA